MEIQFNAQEVSFLMDIVEMMADYYVKNVEGNEKELECCSRIYTKLENSQEGGDYLE